MGQIRGSDFVLVVCTEKYQSRYEKKEQSGQGQGATWEGGLIISELYSGEGINKKHIPILLSPEGEQYIPQSLRAYTVYRLYSESYDPSIAGGFQDLYRHLTGQPAHLAPKLGQRLTLPPIQPALSNLSTSGTIIPSEDSSATQRQAELLGRQSSPHPSSRQKPEIVTERPPRSGQPVPQGRKLPYSIVWLSIAFLTILAGVAGVGVWIGQNLGDPTVSPETNQVISVPNSLQDRISAGEKILISNEDNRTDPNPAFQSEKLRGVEAIAAKDYGKAIIALENAISLYQNAPETLIYLNNARIGLDKAHTIAVVAPSGSNVDPALAILRGVAQAQDEINQNGGINGVLLRVVIVNDDNDEVIASEIASTLAKDSEILGVIGHFSSGVTLATREIYDTQQLPSISATSTSIDLSHKAAGNIAGYGFRVVPNDGIAARALADHMTGTLNKKQVAVFYEQGSSYSESLKKEFTLSVSQEGGEVVGEFDVGETDFNGLFRICG
jgi:hypothetical protein